MNIQLKRATLNEAEFILKMQKEAFAELLEKYQDYETNPGNENIDKIIARLNQDFTYYYLICFSDETGNNEVAGAIRVVDGKDGNRKRISPVFVLPKYWNMGIAQKAIQAAEEIHGNTNWKLDTILQEEKNCHLYEKMGYRKTGKTEKVNEKLTLVFYEKDDEPKVEQKIDFSTITACGECCAECSKKVKGICKGCIEADGYVPEWSASGQCKVHACAKKHNAQFCGLCPEFPCADLTTIIHWNPRIVEHLSKLAERYREEYGF